jgi:gamma-glutamyltranspeptidase / glutathione hydrolase
MIAAANPLAAQAGLSVLRAGGSAVDAAIAAQMVLTLVEPQSSGIGGGAFLLHFKPGKPEVGRDPLFNAYDGRESAPAAATDSLFLNSLGRPFPFRFRQAGGRGVGVPGLLRMLERAHQDHGTLPWSRLFDHAILLAEKGFDVSPRLHAMIKRDRHLKNFPVARRYFYTDDGKPLPVGTRLRNTNLARTFKQVARGGADAFYTGRLAADIAAAVRNTLHLPAEMTTLDLTRYQAKDRRILCRPYRKWRICGMPPPTSGGIATLQILGMLERFDLSRLKPGSTQAVHLISEASRLAFADRNLYLADPDFVDVPTKGLLDPDYLRLRAGEISAVQSMGKALPGVPPQTASWEHAPDTGEQRPISTSHISVVDSKGRSVSMTTTIGTPFGSRIMVGGFMLNDELTDFAAEPVKDGRRVANRPGPRKRPRSSMSPTIVTDRDGRLVMSVGSPGGSSIIGYVTKTLIGALDWKLSMQEAIALPNHVNKNIRTELEQGTALERIKPGLIGLGHEIRVRPKTSGLHGIIVRPNGLDGGADPRREGVAIGD